MKKLFFAMASVFLLLSCSNEGDESQNQGSGSQNQTPNASDVTAGEEKLEESRISPDAISDILQSIPSPLEISFLIKEQGSGYNKADLNPHTLVTQYNNNYNKALNLGVYGTDLGYTNIYEKNQDALNYLNSIKKLADGLNIGQFFDYNTVKKLAESSDNLEELLIQTTINFENINTHLRERGQENLSILILTGGWVEALYLTCLVYERSKNDIVKEKIGEQKVVLNPILLVLNEYQDRPGFKELVAELSKLQNIYDDVKIETVYEEPTAIERDGVLVVVDNTRSEVTITDQQIQNIQHLITLIRNKIIE